MRFLLEPPPAATLDAWTAAARAAHDAGLDGVLIAGGGAPLVTAAALAGIVPDILLAVEMPLGDRHPIEVAEEAAVVDLASGGRLVLMATPAPGAEAAYGEALDLLRRAWTPRPFRVDGPHWTVPAGLPGNLHNAERLTRVTPAPAGPRLELWGAGGGLPAAASRALGWAADVDTPDARLAELVAETEQRLGPAAIGAPRARRERWGDAATLRERLLAGRAAFGQDWALVDAGAEHAREIGRAVRPYLQLDALPPGLAEHWEASDNQPAV